MKLEELKALSDRELDALLAEKVLGETVCRNVPVTYDPECGYPNPTGRFAVAFEIAALHCIGEYCKEFQEDEYRKKVPVAGGHQPSCLTIIPHFSKSLDAIAPLEAKVIEKVGLADYVNAIRRAVNISSNWGAVTASARHRAEACLLCWEGE